VDTSTDGLIPARRRRPTRIVPLRRRLLWARKGPLLSWIGPRAGRWAARGASKHPSLQRSPVPPSCRVDSTPY
jgi:hypothetical protein